MGLEDKIWELVGAVPGLAVALVILFWLLKALNKRDDTIRQIAKEHHEAYVANQKVVEDNSRVIGECSAVMRDCREEIRDSRRRSPA